MTTGMRWLVMMTLLALSLTARAEVTAELDRDRIQSGDTVQLNLQRDSGGGDPDLKPLDKDFDVLGSSSGSSIQIVNGSISRHKSVRVVLSPKHAGTLTIPAIRWGGEQSQPLQLDVSDGGGSSQGAGGGARSPHVFITSKLDEPRPYVQSAVLLTVQLHTDLPLQQASLDFTGNNDVQVQQIGDDRQSRETRDGHTFNVVERQYLLLPQRSGSVKLEGPTLDARVADSGGNGLFGNDPFFSGMLGNTRPIRVHGEPLTLDIESRPDTAQGSDWLPAHSLNLVQSLSADPAQLHAGDPLTLHLHLRAEGLSGAQLPDLSSKLRLPDGVKAYPDQAKLDTRVENGVIVGTRDQDIALIANQAGHYRLPEVHVPWWDSKTRQPREFVLPALTLDVAAASGANPVAPAPDVPAAAPPSEDVSHSQASPAIKVADSPHQLVAASVWPWIAMALGGLWIATLVGWWLHVRMLRRSRGVGAAPASARKLEKRQDARRHFLQACRRNDAAAARRELLNWVRLNDSAQPADGLTTLAQRFERAGRADLAEPLQALDRACYTGREWNGEALAKALERLPTERKARAGKAADLQGLYP